MMAKSYISYKPIVNTDSTTPSMCWSKWWPKLSRYKAVAIVITVFSIISIIVSCLDLDIIHSASMCFFSKNKNSTEGHFYTRMHFHHSKRRLPECLIIGARKAGTRALLQFLRFHPDVQGAGQEVHFFDKDSNYQLGYEWYRHQMPYSFKGQITLEKSPAYFTESVVPQRVYRMNSSIKLLLIVRDPVERTISDYAQLLDNKIKRNLPARPFEELVVDPDTGEINKSYVVIKRSIYHRHLQKWSHFFPISQIHIVDGDTLRTHPWEEMYKVEEYLGLEHKVGKDKFAFNNTRGVYCPLSSDGKQHCLAHGKGRKHPDVRLDVILKLKEFFQPHNEKFFRQINRRFPW